MTTRSTKMGWRRVGGYVALLLLLLLVVGLFSISYAAGLALLLGILAAWLGRVVYVPLFTWLRRTGLRGKILFAIVLLALIAGSVLYYNLFMAFTPDEAQEAGIAGLASFEADLARYQATVKPASPDLDRFVVNETAVVLKPSTGEMVVSLPERQVQSRERGFLLQEVDFTPLQADESGEITLDLPDGATLVQPLCALSCPVSTIELIEFPEDTFHSAREADQLQVFPYLDTETVTWSAVNLERGITFAYIPPPYQYGRSILEPFLGLSSFNGWAIALMGVVGTMILNPFLESVLPDVMVGQLRDWVRRSTEEKEEKRG